MVKQNRCGRGTNGFGGKNEFLLLQAQDLAAHNTGHIHPVHAAQGNNDALDTGTQHLHDQDNIQRQGNGGDNIHNTHHDHIHGATQVTGNTANAAIKATSMEMRVPYIRRVSTSRPRASVPRM